MTTSTQSVTTQPQLPIGFSDEVPDLVWQHIASYTTPRTFRALECTCKRFQNLTQLCTVDASAMTIAAFENLPVNEVALKVILPRAYGELLKVYCQSMDEHTAGYEKLPLPSLNALLQKKFPNCARVSISNVDLKSTNARGYTPLSVAQWHSDLGIFRLLLKAGAPTDTIDADGQTPLHRNAFGGRTQMAKLLLDAGADVNAVDRIGAKSIPSRDGETPLYACTRQGYVETAQLLIAHGAKVNVTNRYGRTPLYAAVFRGHLEIVKILLQAGALAKVADESGITPLHILNPQETRHDCFAPRTGNVAQCVEIATLLIQAGANVNATDRYGRTPLDNTHNETLRELLKAHGAKTGEELRAETE